MLLVGLSWNEETDKYVMISERANDGSLDDHMFDIPDYRWETIIRCIHEIADSLAEIHRAGIIHRNLHPGNVVMHRGVPYLIDTGLAAHVVRSKGKQGVYGRLAYLPPEVFEGKPYTQSSDVYCLGTIFWQLITGVPPRGIAGSLYRNSREERIPGLLPDIQSIIFDCWNPDPRGRPTAEAVRERILLAYQKRPALFSAMTRNFIKDRREAHLDQLERDLFDITKADAAWADAWARSDDIDLEKAYRKLVAHAWSKSDFFTTFELKKLHRLHAVAMKDDVISFGPSPSPSTSWTPVLKSMFGFFKGPNSP
ncbi:kinase-like domain-containing protein [Jimgerdemannia flammicorona]|uniref:Kinase-like domain-containing protein n=1 Tax=Jimgerdemannia flammicorona TaxID=994334 RepID=A0A432ZZR0_9FUNG|nr:kinase-like domain-containing protein [Jimgerdemannia flammicorona]